MGRHDQVGLLLLGEVSPVDVQADDEGDRIAVDGVCRLFAMKALR